MRLTPVSRAVVAAVALLVVVSGGCAVLGQAVPGAARAQPATPNADVAAKMVQSIRSSPYLHVTADVTSGDKTYHIEAWMSESRLHQEVWHDGRIEFAKYVGEGRTQEFVPRADFGNGGKAEDVLLEYDAGLNNVNNDWPRLVDPGFACDAAGPGCVSWLDRRVAQSDPEVVAENIVSSSMSEGALKGVPCYIFTHVARSGEGESSTWQLYLDKATCEPLERVKSFQNGTKIKVHRTEYHLEHLQSDQGVPWRLELADLLRNQDKAGRGRAAREGAKSPPAPPETGPAAPSAGGSQSPMR